MKSLKNYINFCKKFKNPYLPKINKPNYKNKIILSEEMYHQQYYNLYNWSYSDDNLQLLYNMRV